MTNEFQNRIIEKLKRECGEELLNELYDPKTIEIMLNSDSTLWVEKLGEDMKYLYNFPRERSKSIIETVATYLNTTANADNPILECELPIDGSRFEALLPPLVQHPSFTIRKKATQIFTLENYLNNNIISEEQLENLEYAIVKRKNILVIGGTGSGKTTFSNAIIHGISELTPKHRIVIIEDTAELQCASENKVILRANAEVSMLKLLKATMRLRPDRIIVGEVRGAEALDLIKAWNTGHSGGIATVHANGAYAGLKRLEQLISEATSSPMQELIAEAINLAVFIKKTKEGRRIEEIIEITGFDHKANEYIYKKL